MNGTRLSKTAQSTSSLALLTIFSPGSLPRVCRPFVDHVINLKRIWGHSLQMASNGVSSMDHLQESLEGFIEKLRVVGVIAGDYQLDNPAILKDKVYVFLRDRQPYIISRVHILYVSTTSQISRRCQQFFQ